MTVVVDTNVILVANRQHGDVSDRCVVICAQRLQAIKEGERVAIDHDFLILGEYLNKTQPRVGKRVGDAFVKWLLQNKANPQRCDIVPLVRHPERHFHSFPDDRRLAEFDPPDRKFVAVAAAHAESAAILQASDSKWLDWESALRDHGVMVEFLCPSDIAGFRERKKRKVSRR